MEDTKSLLIMVLHKIFHDRPKIVEDTYQLIYNYNSGKRESAEYEKILKTICDLMNDELPSEILVYLLTLVDIPQENGNQPPIIEKIQKTYSCLSKSVRPTLLDYLSNKKFSNVEMKSEAPSFEEVNSEATINKEAIPSTDANKSNNDLQQLGQDTPNYLSTKKSPKKVITRTRSRRKLKNNNSKSFASEENEPLGSLQDIAANYVIKNQQRLKLMHKSKLAQAWKLINSNSINEDNLKKCYKTVEDLNKKAKLLRCIENDNLSNDLFIEDNDFLLRNNNIFKKDPFEMPQNVIDRLQQFLT